MFDLSIPGWMTRTDLEALERIALKHKPATMLEIGSFAGRSSVCWAATLPASLVYCVDPWHFKTGDLPPNDRAFMEGVWVDDDNIDIYDIFRKHTLKYKNIIPIKARSDEVEAWSKLVPSVDLVFIDGDHTLTGITKDLDVAHALTEGKGVICGHDYSHPKLQHIKSVVNSFAHGKGYALSTFSGSSVFLLEKP